MQSALARLPLAFVENRGQLPASAAFGVEGRGGGVRFGAGRATYHVKGSSFDVAFVGARDVRPVAVDRLPGVVSYFRGPVSNWRTALPTFRRLVYRRLWPGIDLVYRGPRGRLEYDLVLQPGADPGRIRFRYGGASLRAEGASLRIAVPGRTLREGRPVAFQGHHHVGAGYVVRGNEVGLRLGPYDHHRPLLIDPPSFLYAGFLGGSGEDIVNGIAVDRAGSAYVTGWTNSANFPASKGPDSTYGGSLDAFVAKLNPSGTALLYSSYIGGTGDDYGIGIAVDRSGNAYVSGASSSSQDSFPVKGGPDLTYNGGFSDAFVAKIAARGTALVYSGYLGGPGQDQGEGITVDGAGAAYLSGTASSGFPTAVGPDLTPNGDVDGFVAKVSPTGQKLVYSGYIGGAGLDDAYAIAVDRAGNAYVSGDTHSTETSFPVAVGPDLTFNGGTSDAFVAKVNKTGSGLDYAGYIGGSGDENYDNRAAGVAVDAGGNAYVTGETTSDQTTFPVKVGPDLTFNGAEDAFVAKVNPSGSALSYAGYIGGSG